MMTKNCDTYWVNSINSFSQHTKLCSSRTLDLISSIVHSMVHTKNHMVHIQSKNILAALNKK